MRLTSAKVPGTLPGCIGSEYLSRWTAIETIAPKIACSGHTLPEWMKKAEVDSSKRAGVRTEVAKKLKALERENREPQPVTNNINRFPKPTRS